jgi:CRISPR/Cas system-associated exonuclease Cas4 (RecB family)
MPTKPSPQITAWSWSRLYDYETCPALCKYKHVEKIKTGQPEKPVLLAGTKAHADCEAYMTRKPGSTITPAMVNFRAEFQALRKKLKPSQVETELKIAFNKDWQPVDWFAHDAWLRVVIDLTYVEPKEARREVVDYKTGKNRESAYPQLRLYNLVSFFMSPKVKVAHSAFWYLDQGVTHEELLLEGEVEKEQAAWLKKIKPMFADRLFMPKPGRSCQWCDYAKSKGGPCAY